MLLASRNFLEFESGDLVKGDNIPKAHQPHRIPRSGKIVEQIRYGRLSSGDKNESESFEPAEFIDVAPSGDEVGVGDDDARGIFAGFEGADRVAILDEEV